MEAKDNQGNMKDRTKRAAAILVSVLAYIGLCVVLALYVSPGNIWSGSVGLVDGLLLVLLAVSGFCIAVIDPTFRIGKMNRRMISILLWVYAATVICLFMANGWWRPENIDILYNNDIFKSIGLYSEGYLAQKIFGLIIAAIAVALLLCAINYIIYKVIDSAKKEVADGETLPDIIIDDLFQRNPFADKDTSATVKTSTCNENDDESDNKTERTWKKWAVVGIIFAAVLFVFIFAIVMHPDISGFISQQKEGIARDILSIFSFLLSILASAFCIAIAVITIGYVYRTIAGIIKNIKKWTKGDIAGLTERLPGFFSWVLSVTAIWWITDSTEIGDIISSFKSPLSSNDFVNTFIAIILTVTVIWFLKMIIKMLIEIFIDNNNSKKKEPENLKEKARFHLRNIVEKLIVNALGIIEKTVDLSENAPVFVQEANCLIKSSENNPDEIEKVIVDSKTRAIEDDLELESFCHDMRGGC